MERYSSFIGPEVEYTTYGKPIYKDLPLTVFEKTLNLVTLAVLGISWVYAIVSLSNLPNTVVSSFGQFESIEHLESKYAVLIVPVIASIFAFVLYFITLRPHRYSISNTRITARNAYRIYVATRTLVRYVSAIFSTLLLLTLVFWIKSVKSEESLNAGLFLSAVFGIMAVLVIGVVMLVNQSNKKEEDP